MTRLLFVAVVLASCKKAAVVPPPVDPLAEVLPVDPGVLHGQYANGMKWFVESNGEPADRVVFRLVVAAGSAVEADDQRGLAHLLEHMAFNGTPSFPGTELVTYLESLGTRFGPHLNAHTTFHETVYKLTVPVSDEKSLDAALTVLGEWACCIALDPEEIEKERGVVLEEWRGRLGVGSRVSDRTVPLTYWGSDYADRLPIGTEESLRGFEPDALRRYHSDWYRPELMAIVAVGDFDAAEMAARLEARFSPLAGSDEPTPRPTYTLPDQPEPFYTVIADPEATRTSISRIAKFDAPIAKTVRDYRDMLVEEVALGVLNERLGEIAQRAGAPWLGAGAGSQDLMVGESAHAMFAATHEGDVLAGYEALQVEVQRFVRHGVTADELERAKASVLRGYESYLEEVETTDSVEHAEEIVRHFIEFETMPGTAFEVELAKRFVPGFELDEINRWAAGFAASPSTVLTVIMPEKEGLPVPTVEQIREIEARVAAMEIPPPVPKGAIAALVDERPTPGAIASTDTRFVEKLGFTGWTLTNGARVWFKPTDHKADELLFRAWNDGGFSAVDDADFVSALAAPQVRAASGLGEHDPNDLVRFMSGRIASVGENIGVYGTTIGGMASPTDLETALQLVHLGITSPRFTEDGVDLTRERWSAALLNREKDPNARFIDAWNQLRFPDDPRSRPLAPADVERIDGGAAERIWRAAFSNPADFTFVFVGRLPADFEEQVTTWIGGIPASDESLGVKDRGVRRRPGDHRVVVRHGIEKKARFRTEFWGPLPENTWENRNRLYALADVLGVLLRERLREDLGGVYGVGVSAQEWYEPDQGYAITIDFSCDPERLNELEREVRGVIASVRKDGVDARYVDSLIAKNLQTHQETVKTNGFWLQAFSGALDRGADPLDLLGYEDRTRSLTPALIQKAASDWLQPGRSSTAVLLPAL